MANKVRVELNRAGVRQLLKSDEFLEACVQEAEKMASRAGDGFEVSPYVGKTRVNASVYAATEEALAKVYDDNTLLKSM